MIRFLINNDVVELNEARADLTLLQFIREHRKKTGTKEGCAAGDCGACTVVLVEPASSNSSAELNYRTVNSCITLMSAVHGKQLLFVEHLNDGKHLHPVQQALVDHHGSQCGFCTPGFIMSMFALYHSNTKPNRDDVLHALSGNLCRCTGYRPIIDATMAVCEQTPDDQFTARQAATLSTLLSLSGEKTHWYGKYPYANVSRRTEDSDSSASNCTASRWQHGFKPSVHATAKRCRNAYQCDAY